LWNASASELWRRTSTNIYRALARLLSRTEKRVRSEVSVQYVKAAEFQRRGLLHFHLVIRLDAADRRWSWPDGVPWREPHRFAPPPADYTVDLLADAVRTAAAVTTAPLPQPDGDLPRVIAARKVAVHTQDRITARHKRRRRTSTHGVGQGPVPVRGADAAGTLDAPPALDAGDHGPDRAPHPAPPRLPLAATGPVRHLAPPALAIRLEVIGWGEQVDVRPIPTANQADLGDGVHSRERIGGYLAKYATKHTEALGALDRRLDLDDVAHLAVNPHVHRLVVTCWLLAHWYPHLRLAEWSHQLGYGGHWLTKSRRYSTTLSKLRHARVLWAQRHQLEAMARMDPWERLLASARTVVWTRWQLQGIGHPDSATALLAAAVRNEQRVARDALRGHRERLDDLHALAT